MEDFYPIQQVSEPISFEFPLTEVILYTLLYRLPCYTVLSIEVIFDFA